MIVGGTFGDTPKASSVIKKLTDLLAEAIIPFYKNCNIWCINGGPIKQLTSEDYTQYDLIIWAPNVSNDVEKFYPKKKTGAVLICSKVLRDDRTIGDAVARIFKMSANAVIAIDSDETGKFMFHFVDALGNLWCKTTDIKELSISILKLYNWSTESIRVASKRVTGMCIKDLKMTTPKDLPDFCNIIKTVAAKVEAQRGGRYFGNASTRCSKLFPSFRPAEKSQCIMVSSRNIPKASISPDDFIAARAINNDITSNYFFYEVDESKKPSVDTPIQLFIYSNFKKINYIIHGHAYINMVPLTQYYYPCGDMREISEISSVLADKNSEKDGVFAINLRNHGFIIAATSLKKMKKFVENSNFRYRQIGEEPAVIKL